MTSVGILQCSHRVDRKRLVIGGGFLFTRARSASRWALTGLGLLGAAGSVVLVARLEPSWAATAVLAVTLAGVALVVAWSSLDRDIATCRARRCEGNEPARRPTLAARVQGGTAAVLAGVTVSQANRVITDGGSNGLLAAAWLGSIGAVVAASWWDERRRLRMSIPLTRRTMRIAMPWIGVVLLAALPRLLARDRFPTVMDSDEAAFALIARSARDGTLPDPFGTGFFSTPNLYLVAEGWLAALLGSDTGDYRALSGIIGVLGVLATWRLGRRVVGPAAALAGAVILAVMPLHLYLSRTTLNNVTDPAALMLALLLLHRAVRSGRRLDAAIAGLTLGLAFYGYYGGRVLWAVVLLVLLALVLGSHVRAVNALRIAGWIAGAFLITAMPLIVSYWHQPEELGGHVDHVSQLSPGTLRDDPVVYLQAYLPNMRNALLYPIAGNEWGFWRQSPPYLGWPIAALLVIGAGALLARVFRDRDMTLLAFIALPWLLLSAGIALTIPIAGQRLAALTPFYALTAGVGVIVIARWLEVALHRVVPRAAVLATWTLLLALTVGHVAWFASENRQLANYLDRRTLIAWDIGWRASQPVPEGQVPPSILFAGPPHMLSGGFNNLTWLAPDLQMTDVPDPIDARTDLELPPGAMLVIIDERAGERCEAEEVFPDLRVAEARAHDGSLLYVALYREPLSGWSLLRSPAGSTFGVTVTSPCERAGGSSPAS